VRVEGHSGPHAELADALQGAMQVGAGLPVHADLVAAQGGQPLQIVVRVGDHEVDVQADLRKRFGYRFGDRESEGKIGHKVPVHEIQV
jgi:hypothetical protein